MPTGEVEHVQRLTAYYLPHAHLSAVSQAVYCIALHDYCCRAKVARLVPFLVRMDVCKVTLDSIRYFIKSLSIRL